MKAAAIVAGAMGVVAALVVAAEDWVFSAFFGLPALALLIARFRGWWRVQVAAQLVLIVELICRRDMAISGNHWGAHRVALVRSGHHLPDQGPRASVGRDLSPGLDAARLGTTAIAGVRARDPATLTPSNTLCLPPHGRRKTTDRGLFDRVPRKCGCLSKSPWRSMRSGRVVVPTQTRTLGFEKR